MTTFKLHQKFRFRNYYPQGSKYKRCEGKTGKIVYVNGSNSYDVEIDGLKSNNRINYVRGDMLETYESGLPDEQKRKIIFTDLKSRISDAQKVIDEKQELIATTRLKIEYLEKHPEFTVLNETNFLAWKTSQAIIAYLVNTNNVHPFVVKYDKSIGDIITSLIIPTLEEIKNK